MNHNSHLDIRKYWLHIAAFAIPFLVTAICAVSQGLVPFGDRSVVCIDANDQYVPFIALYREKLLNGESLYFSWKGGAGFNFLSTWAYYLSSPLNLVYLLFPKSAIGTVYSWLVLFKLGLMGLTMASFLLTRSKDRPYLVLMFSTAYALSNYCIGNAWNSMWLDVLVLLPVVLIGFDRLMKQRKPALYVLMLALAIICNYYIAFMMCIFLVLWFLMEPHGTKKQWLIDGTWFAGMSLLGAAISAVVLIPGVAGVMTTQAGGEMGLPAHEWYKDFRATCSAQISSTFSFQLAANGNANLYCGAISLLLCVLFFVRREIPRRAKFVRGAVLLFFLISFNESILNFIWHGFHEQNGIPNRFAYLYIFLFLYTGFEAIRDLEQVRGREIGIATVITLAITTVLSVGVPFEVDYIDIMSKVAYIIVPVLLYLLRREGKLKTSAVWGIIFAIALYDVLSSMSVQSGLLATRQDADPVARDVAGEHIGIGEDNTVRTLTYHETCYNEGVYAGTNDLSLFSSTIGDAYADTMQSLGFHRRTNCVLGFGYTPFTATLLNIGYTALGGAGEGLPGWTLQANDGSLGLYANDYETYAGYLMRENPAPATEGETPFEVQNRWSLQAFGGEALYEQQAVTYMDETQEYEGGKWTGAARFYETVVPADGEYYAFFDTKSEETVSVSANGTSCGGTGYRSTVFYLGKRTAGEILKAEVTYTEDEQEIFEENECHGYIARFDREAFERLHHTMCEASFQLGEYTEDGLYGSINATHEGVLLLSAAYDKGFHIYVDGEETDTVAVGGGLLGVPIATGYHDIVVRFVPSGFYAGCLLSALGLVGLVVIEIILRLSSSKKRKA